MKLRSLISYMKPEIVNKYNEYLASHIANVKKGYDWLCIYLPELIPAEISDLIAENIYSHDRSKYGPDEYNPYCEYFYGTKSKE